MTSTLVAPTSSNLAHQVHSPNLERNQCASWRRHVVQPQDAYPSLPTPHTVGLQESLSMDPLRLPPSRETARRSSLTTALIDAKYTERQAENQLISARLKRAKIEQELYGHMEAQRSHRLHKADNSVGITRRGYPSCGPFPIAGDASDLGDSDLDSDHESDVEASS